ncbi:uncharacterized protein TNCV_4072271 [Trichonephila clavipes]|uniref:Uncharacterized protein n=1 Tax=Trichonephila clavipes TaxID=2585209 RepID=A0A8X7BGR0_TRICX|nr:uncharacterized protein TNCV_4072271 [Trichonephila clavipes]
MIANYVNEQHDIWDQFLREFAYAIRTAVNETTGKTPAELFLGLKLITPFKKLVMVSDGTEFAVGDIERFNTSFKFGNKKSGIAKFKPKFEGPYRVLDVKNNNVVIWKAGKRLTINVDHVRIYRHRKCDETEIGTGSSDNGSLCDESSGFDRVQRRSNESQDGKKKGARQNEEDQFDPEKAEEGTIAPTSKNEHKNARRGGDQQRQDQERRGACTKKSLSLEVLVGNASYKS